MSSSHWPFKDYDYIGDRYVNVKDPNAECGEIMWYERDIDRDNTPTECVLCIEAENEMYTKYAHPKAHFEGHKEAEVFAKQMAFKKKETEEYIEYYTFYYGREYRRIYNVLYKQYKQEYANILLEKTYDKDDRICEYHLESIQYHGELKSSESESGEQAPSGTYEYRVVPKLSAPPAGALNLAYNTNMGSRL
jgi:hypothetical protein